MGYFTVHEYKKNEVWDHALSLPKSSRPNGVTDKRLEKVKDFIWTNTDFWSDIVNRHGLIQETIGSLQCYDHPTYDHCIGNFWGQVVEEMMKRDII